MASKIPLMRKSVAVWLIENTSLTFQQIADFCDMHELEVQSIADGETSVGIVGKSPIVIGQLTKEMIEKCEKDPNKKLELKELAIEKLEQPKKKKTKYVPIAKRSDKPNAILYLLKYYPNITDEQIKKLIGTTKNMVDSIKNKTYWNIKELTPKDPVLLGLCSQFSFNNIVSEIENTDKKK